MDWDHVRIFLAVARSGQLLLAARLLGVNHATVGRRVTALENSLQAKLVERGTTGCSLTPAGEQFLIAAERMEAEMLNARSAIAGTDIEIAGTVRIAAPDSFWITFLAPRLRPLLERYPELTIQLMPISQAFSLSKREVDIAIRVDRPKQGRFVARKLVDYSLGLYASTDYVKHHGAPATIEDLSRHLLIGYIEDIIPTQALNYYVEVDKHWSSRFQCASALGHLQAVRAGVGIGFLHTFIARDDRTLVPILSDTLVRRAYWVTYHESTRSLRRITMVSAFINDLVEKERHTFA